MFDDLGKRMKENYEGISKLRLTRRTPVIIRLDGKAFHTFTKGLKKPFDEILMKTMQDTMLALCSTVQGCVLGYTQSDEITLVLVDYKKFNSSAWFDNELQKLVSISASLATLAFNKYFHHNTLDANLSMEEEDLYASKFMNAIFDSRAFNIPKEEVANCILWREFDAERNSVQMVGQANFSHKELQKKSCADIKKMLIEQKGINWDELPTDKKHGCCAIRKDGKWVIDHDTPMFLAENKKYIDNLLKPDEE